MWKLYQGNGEGTLARLILVENADYSSRLSLPELFGYAEKVLKISLITVGILITHAGKQTLHHWKFGHRSHSLQYLGINGLTYLSVDGKVFKGKNSIILKRLILQKLPRAFECIALSAY